MTSDEIMELRARVRSRGALYIRNAEGRAGLDPIKVEELLDDVDRALLEHADLAAERDRGSLEGP